MSPDSSFPISPISPISPDGAPPPHVVPHVLDAALVLTPQGPGRWTVPTSEIYWNLVGPYGGWLFAAGVKAILGHADALGDPVEAHARFMAAPKPGLLEIRVERQAQGKSVGFWRAGLWQTIDGRERLCTEVSMILAVARDTLEHPGIQMPDVARPEQLAGVTARANPQVRWLGHFDHRYVDGAPFQRQPDTPAPDSLRSRVWVNTSAPRPLDWVGLIAFADLPVPRVFLLQSGPSPVSTVSMSVYLRVNSAELATTGADHLLLDIDGTMARHGFVDHSVNIWRRDGKLLATSTQLAWFA